MMLGVVLMVGLSGGMGVLQPEVRQDGSMREVMRDGQTEGRVLLSEAAEESGAIAVGALEWLGGEVTIVEGEAWVSRVVDGELVVGCRFLRAGLGWRDDASRDVNSRARGGGYRWSDGDGSR